MRKLILVIAAAILGMFAFTGCGTQNAGTGQQVQSTVQQSNYDKLVKSQPAHTMSYSPTRATKNFWIDTWNTPGKLAYVYLRSANGNVFGYYITVGLPVSYCTGLVVPYKIVEDGNVGSNGSGFVVPAPSIDGTYASAANCNEYYGKDAVSGAYVEYSVGMGINQQISDRPLPQYGDAQPLGQATVKAAANK